MMYSFCVCGGIAAVKQRCIAGRRLSRVDVRWGQLFLMFGTLSPPLPVVLLVLYCCPLGPNTVTV